MYLFKGSQYAVLLSLVGLAGCDWLATFPHEHDEHNQADCDETESDSSDEHNGDSTNENSENDLSDEEESSDGNGGGTTEPDSSCTYNSFSPVTEGAGQIGDNPDKPWFRYLAFSTKNAPGDMFVLDSFQGSPYYGADEPGTYSFEGTNYVDCSLCFVIWYQCDEEYNCEKAFLADEGSIEITSMDGAGSIFQATLKDVVLHEVSIDTESYISTPVAGGDTWCLDEYPLEAIIQQWE